MKKIIAILSITVISLGLVSCSEFLNRPGEDNYNVDNFYLTDEQCEQGVNSLYNSPWYDFQRGFFKVGEIFSGNLYMGSSPYMDYSVNGTDEDLMNMSYSLWAVNGHANTMINNLLNARGKGASDKAIYKSIAECLTWKAMAYFYLVRTFGEVPIIHDNNKLLTGGGYNKVSKVTRANVYEYIQLTLEKAMELFDKYDVKKTSGWADYERIDYYTAEALLSKVCLTAAGLGGTLDPALLKKAADYAKDVIDYSGRTLNPVYADVFKLKSFNTTGECLLSWQWTVSSNWTSQNTLQSDLGLDGFDEFGDLWGDWNVPTIDLMNAFGVDSKDDPALRNNTDVRRKASFMMPGDFYDYFWTDHTDANGKVGFNYLQFLFDKDGYGAGSEGNLASGTGANVAKHMYGDTYDHEQATGISPARMAYQLPTHLLRLSDVYLIYAEAELLGGHPEKALDYVNAVRERAHIADLSSVTFDDIWKERRLELALEGDRWYDFVRRSYYDEAGCLAELASMKRGTYNGLSDVAEKWLGDDFKNSGTWDASAVTYNDNYDNPSLSSRIFTLPFPTEDVVFNAQMASTAEAVDVDVRATYSYDF